MRAMLNAMREEENILRANLGIFKIEQPASKDLQNLEKVVCSRKVLSSFLKKEVIIKMSWCRVSGGHNCPG